jgi:tetratricopeptide (TPR) repeat protein
MHAIIHPMGTDILCRSAETAPSELRLNGPEGQTALERWAARYGAAVRDNREDELLAIGRELFDWLDENGWGSAWAKASGPRVLEIQIDDPSELLAQALLDAPWELLARADGHLADDPVQLFEVGRRIGAAGDPIVPAHSDLQLMFMVAAPEGPQVLDFEAEEAAILDATRRLPLHLVVEESGCAEYLGERLDLDGPFEALHLSCHGDIHPERGPVLALEDPVGEVALADAGRIVHLLGDPERTPLVFLSACRTAERESSRDWRFEPFVRDLTRAGVANVLGWDGSVYDADAMAFAQVFYQELAGRDPIPLAAARARLALRQARMADPNRGRHWHLARLYLGSRGGGALTAKGQPKRKPAPDAYQDQFLDKARGEVPVAKRAEFVGRRRQAQAVLKAFRDGAAGVLIHGMASLGKSSLAARITSRMNNRKTVVVFKNYDELTVFDRIVEALPPTRRAETKVAWRDAILADPTALRDALEALLEAPLDDQPMLLIVDDLERILEKPQPLSQGPTPVQPRHRAALSAILGAFDRARTESRLLITSRYRFTLPDGRGDDLAEKLVRVPLQPMAEGDRLKQLRAAATLAERAELDQTLTVRALNVAGGNPGLQATLLRPILSGEVETAAQALEAVEHYRRTGAPPEAIRRLMAEGAAQDTENAIVAFFKRMAFDAYRAALTESQAKMLGAAGVFSVGLPIPRPALEATGSAAGVADAGAALERLLGLGLADDWGALEGIPHAAANPLARPLAGALDEQTRARLAAAALPPLDAAWRWDGAFPRDPRAVEITRLALVAPAPDPAMLDRAAEAAGRYLWSEHAAPRAHEEVLQPALVRLEALGATPSHGLHLIACDCAERIGDAEAWDRALSMLARSDAQGADRAVALVYLGRRHQQSGNLPAAEKAFVEAAQHFAEAGQERERVIALGDSADILQARGELDEALALHEQRLPIAQQMNNIEIIAHIKYSTASIRLQRGDHQTGGLQQIYEDLNEAFTISLKLGRPDFIGGIGQLLAQILAMGGLKEEALEVLDYAEAAFDKIGNAQGLTHVRQLREMIGGA